MLLSREDLDAMMMLWVCDEAEHNREAPSEGFMVEVTGMNRYELRDYREKMLNRADFLSKRHIATRRAKSSP